MGTLRDLVLSRAGDQHPGLVFEDSTWSWAEVVEEAARRGRLAQQLRRPGPFHVAVVLDNIPEYLLWIAGAGLVGATVVGVNTTRRGAELATDIRHTDCQLVVTDAEHLPLVESLDLGLDPARILVVDSSAYEKALSEQASDLPDAEVGESDLAMLLFTSGSTAAPKAVVCTSGRLARIAGSAAAAYGITRDDVCYNAMPMFHGNAIMANITPAMAVGATVVLRRRFSASGFIDDVRRYGVTYFNYVGRALAYILASPATDGDRDHRLRLGFGTEATEHDRARFEQRFGCPLVESYGSSEGGIAIAVTPDTPPGSLGLPRATIAMDVVVVDPHTMGECPRAEFDDSGRLLNADKAIGELVNRAGDPFFEGYYGNPEAELERRRGGWYWSGDLAYRDAAGFFYFAGRGGDWLRVDSENFAAAPVERILSRHPAVAVAAVYPVPDPRTGDQVMAAVELIPGRALDDLASFLDSQADLGTKWAPTFVRVVEHMPVTANNKISKAGLRREGWRTTDPVLWRPTRGEPYRLLTSTESASLEEEFASFGRTSMLDVS